MLSRPRHRSVLLVLGLLGAAGCREPTAASATVLARQRARWLAHAPSAYRYDYAVSGFFINYADHPIRLEVRNGAVQSATDLTTGQALPGSQWPTIDRLFDDAARAADAGSLRGVRFDPRLGYPTEIDLAGPPDASGSVLASGLQALP